MSTSAKRPAASIISIPFHSIRNISSPADHAEKRLVYAGQMPITSVIGLPTHENVRGYLVEGEGKLKKSPTQVHLAIRETLKERPSVFSVLNSGIVIIARSSSADEKTRLLTLTNSSIINGSQTQGVIREYLKSNGSEADEVFVKFELIVTDDDDLIADISIARNFQNDVQLLSIAGRKGELDELEARLKKSNSSLRLRKSESERPSETNDIIQTEKLLQVIAALTPQELWWKQGEYSKTYTYSAKATCLKDFRRVYEEAKSDDGDDIMAQAYQFSLDIAPQAWEIYTHWKENQAFQGTGLRSIERDGAEIIEVPDGIIFPILAALSQFAVKKRNVWKIVQPAELDDEELVASAKRVYMDMAKSKPEIMGKSRACYYALEQITTIYKRLLKK
ncbi:AIPR family protein [Rugamonas rivuli]|uniref:Abortive phage infection protein C-terminal domain-containing protein n=1 Tax=Rugamonas rivuli TaxID=2743358 RepID=A0A843SA03_9BURK|nr:AIPR family protein [Rugamonas rivuli]MQA21049.1 hypothetical protein [Rugamonas rivuli]